MEDQEIALSSGRRAVRKDGVLFQEFVQDAPRIIAILSKARWQQYLGRPGDEESADLRPQKLLARPKAFFAGDGNDRVFVSAGDFLGIDLHGKFASIPAQDVQHFASLAVRPDAGAEAVEAAARDVLERNARVTQVAEARAENAVSPLSIREDDQGRGLIVSTLPGGREKAWKKFNGKAAAETFLSKKENRLALEEEHARAAKSHQAVNDMAHALRMQDKSDSAR